MALPPSCGKCSHCKSGAVRFNLKLFAVLPQLMFLLWLLLPYLSLFVPSSTIAPVSFPCCGLCVSFQSVPFPKRRKKSHSVVSLFYSTNPSFKSASSITSTEGSSERWLARVQLAWLSLNILRGRERISISFLNYCVHRKGHINTALLVTTALHIQHLYQLLGQDNHRLQLLQQLCTVAYFSSN